ncbi:hypothetical protein OEJ37_06590 [Burkholderia sp. BKH01]|uniref:hypothetical protein n=1 Tax=Burkholderia sp. BKH01 TaxID=2769262 RepID=UPI0021E05980|nr:hypothetical protein [Burkholderia sp. BKH01]MCU9953027.1 hypothetical protein [Burkholderia sp. BKH01]
MTELIKDILPLGAGIGEFTKFDFGADEIRTTSRATGSRGSDAQRGTRVPPA